MAFMPVSVLVSFRQAGKIQVEGHPSLAAALNNYLRIGFFQSA